MQYRFNEENFKDSYFRIVDAFREQGYSQDEMNTIFTTGLADAILNSSCNDEEVICALCHFCTMVMDIAEKRASYRKTNEDIA